MLANTKYIIVSAAALIIIAVAFMLRSTDVPQLQKEPAVQSAGQFDPSTPNPTPAPRQHGTVDPVGPEEFYFSLASALSAEGFTEDYIQAVVQLYGGFDPRDFVKIEPAALAGQLSQFMHDNAGFQNVSTDDAQDIVTIARQVFEDLQH